MDAGLKQISSIRYDGTGRRVIYNVASNIGYPFGVAVFQVNKLHSPVSVILLELQLNCIALYQISFWGSSLSGKYIS